MGLFNWCVGFDCFWYVECVLRYDRVIKESLEVWSICSDVLMMGYECFW